MKNPFRKIIWSSFTLLAVVVVLFVSMLIYYMPEKHVVIGCVVFISVMALLFISFVLALRKEMLNTLSSLSGLIQDLINGQMTQMFPVQEDTLLL